MLSGCLGFRFSLQLGLRPGFAFRAHIDRPFSRLVLRALGADAYLRGAQFLHCGAAGVLDGLVPVLADGPEMGGALFGRVRFRFWLGLSNRLGPGFGPGRLRPGRGLLDLRLRLRLSACLALALSPVKEPVAV